MRLLLVALFGFCLSSASFAEDAVAAAPVLNSGNTAWMLVATALVLLMTIPGLALFYGGMVRKKNVLSTLMQSFSAVAVVTILWVTVGYSLAFTPGSGFIGGFDKTFLNNIAPDALWPGTTIPEYLFMMFQLTFAIITPALITGAFAERMRFSALLVFVSAWSLLVYVPIAHWVWEGSGWLFTLGALDYAGGTVVHINAGIAGLVAAIVCGKRVGYGRDLMAPHNLVLTLVGAALCWVGWFGFNAGSALAADGRAVLAMVTTQIAASAAALTWVGLEWWLKGKASVLGAASGAIAGLVVITPACGYVLPGSALLLGLFAGIACYWGATWLKYKLKYDDSLDAFGVHGIGGIVGSILTGIFATAAIPGVVPKPVLEQVGVQTIATLATIAYSLVVSYLLLKIIDAVIGLRASEEEQREGLDIALHGEHVD